MTAASRPAPIATLTLNPSLDVSYEVPHLIPDEKAHATQGRYDPGGNGINVSRALKTLGVAAETYCLVAGEIGLLVQRLVSDQVDSLHCVHIQGETRISDTILQGDPRIQYEVSGIGPSVTPQELEQAAAGFLPAGASGFGVLTGSLPPGLGVDTYGDLAKRLAGVGARPVIDASAAILSPALEAKPFLVKPNRYELEMLVGRSLPGLQDVAREARALQAGGVAHVCVSLGADGALLVDADNAYYAKTPEVIVRSTVGAGDSMLAGLVAAFARGEPVERALRLGVACGSGTATKPGTMLFTAADIERHMRDIEVTTLDR